MATKIGRPRTCECGECKTCKQRERQARWWAKQSPERKREIVRGRDRAKVRAAGRRRHARHAERRNAERYQRRLLEPEKERARNATSNAIRDGRLVKRPCEVCGRNKVEAHHDDYSRPLDVRWLCKEHHLDHHFPDRPR